jgi:hypothetical protein
VYIGPSGDFSDIQAGMSGMRSKPAVPWHPVYVSVAAELAVRVRQSVLRERPEQDLGARCASDEEIIEIMGARTRYFLT